MNKDEFNKLDVVSQIEYINKQLENNNSVTSVCKTLSIGRSTIRDRFKKANYIYSKESNKYIDNKDITDVIRAGIEVNDGRITYDINKENDDITDVLQKDSVTEIINKSDEEIRNNLLDLVNNYDVIKDIIELHKCNTSVVKQQIVIDIEEAESKLTTLRVNSKIWDKFKYFSDNHKQYKKVDLLSQAIKEFIEKYE